MKTPNYFALGVDLSATHAELAGALPREDADRIRERHDAVSPMPPTLWPPSWVDRDDDDGEVMQ